MVQTARDCEYFDTKIRSTYFRLATPSAMSRQRANIPLQRRTASVGSNE